MTEPTPTPALSVRKLSVTFHSRRGDIPAVADVGFDVAPGELVALLGESGSGKSVTARAVMGLHTGSAEVRADRIALSGTDLRTLPDRDLRALRGSRMSMVFQDALSALNPVLSIGDQIGELFREHRDMSRRAARQQATDLLGLVGIPAPTQRVGDYPHQFSGGMRQRILIAMAIALEPELVIADEPTTALDVTVQAQILELLDDLRRQLNMAVLLITHDLGVVSEVADRTMVMYAGRIVEASTTEQLLGAPAHPYAQALLRSVPQAGQIGDDLYAIPGTPPDPRRQPSGCPFHPRCDQVVDLCRSERPALRSLPGDRAAACHRAEEVMHAVA
ncbi:oligopeptide transport system ATP-binding protein [Hamadaea flava]|uniref:ABC transporter ATP-binding protein n=1 Tax=Hamadaea flava TaxID=1742688 RepID=A0ABV8LNV8_9ACTN|nr:ABC transporter ATP-binding protein [Hamadaea flava]MCP2323177.1 oligopeptide transport system ATP-binding protein [Hamadaea flava]